MPGILSTAWGQSAALRLRPQAAGRDSETVEENSSIGALKARLFGG